MDMKLGTPLLTALALGAGLVVASPAGAAPAPSVVRLAPGGSVAAALNAVAPGGTVELLAGTHRPATVGPRAYDATVTVRPAAGAEGRVQTGELNLRGIHNLRLEGISTRGVVTIDGGRNVDVVSSQPAGVLVKNGARDVDIIGNAIVGGWNGVAVHGYTGTARPHHVRIAGNRISGQENDNIQIGVAHDVVVEGNVLLDPIGNDHHNDGVQVMGGERITVRGNRMSGQDQAIMAKPETSLGTDSAVVDLRIENNLISRTREFGIILLGTSGTTVSRNTVYDTPKQALLFTGANRAATVVDNVIQVMYVERRATPPAVMVANCVGGGAPRTAIGTIVKNPRFADRIDYELTRRSPCVGLGAVLDLVG